MKKLSRLLVFTLLGMVLCFSLTGCNALDEARDCQGFRIDESTIEYNGYKYKYLPTTENLWPTFSYEKVLSITEPDVPVLLSFFFGDPFYISDDAYFLELEGFSSFAMDGLAYSSYYCREDIYDSVFRRSQSTFEPEGYCYTYGTMNEDYTFEDHTYLLSASEKEAVDTVHNTVTGELLPDYADFNYDYFVELQACSADLLFRTWAYDIAFMNGTYYLIEYSDQNTILYEVPAEFEPTFAAIMSDSVSASQQYEQLFIDDSYL